MNTEVIEIKHFSVEEYLSEISPCLKGIVNNLKISDTWKTQLKIANNFMSSIDNDEGNVIYSKSDSIEIMANHISDEIIEELFDSVKNRYQKNLESMKGSEFVVACIH